MTGKIALIWCAVALFCGCQQKVYIPESSEAGAGNPVPGDSFIDATIGDASYLNPVLATDSASGTINGLVYNGLVRYNKDLTLEGELAERWEIKKGGLEIMFYLRKGVKWHDGEDFTAEDVKFTYEKLIDPKTKTPYGSDYLLVKDFKVIDKYTVRITYGEPFAPAVESWGIGILPKHVFDKGDFNSHPANRKPIGTGPYKFSQWDVDQKIVLEANKDYFEGAPYIQKYFYRIIPDQSVQFLELRNQSIDSMGLTPDQYKAYDEFFIHYNKFRYPAFSYVYMGFNMLSPLFKDKRVRQAFAYAVNKQEIIDGVILGIGQPATGPFPPKSWAYDPEVKSYPYDPAKAKEMLALAGWSDTDGDGWIDKNGRIFEFTIMTNQGNNIRKLCAEIIQAHLAKVGIKAKIRIVEWSAFIHNFIDKKDFEAVILGWNLGRDPDAYSIWHSGQTKEGQYNFVSYKNREVDRLLERGRRTFDMEERKKIYRRIHRILADEKPYLFIYYPDSLPVVHKRFRAVEVAPIGIGWNFRNWWVPKSKQRY